MLNLSPALQGSPSLSVRRRSGGNEPLLSLDMDPTPKKRKQKETSPPLNDQVTAGDPNLGSRLQHAIDMRAQQRQQQVLNEQTPIKEHSERDPSDKESDKGSSSVDGNSAQESAKGSDSNLSILSPSSIVRENPEGTSPKWGDLEDEPEEIANEKSDKVSVPKPLESAKGSGTTLTEESNPDASTGSSAIVHVSEF
jgi:hypothetical protein